MFTPLHMSHVTCHASFFLSFFFFFFLTKWWSQRVEDLLSTGPTQSSLLTTSTRMIIFCVTPEATNIGFLGYQGKENYEHFGGSFFPKKETKTKKKQYTNTITKFFQTPYYNTRRDDPWTQYYQKLGKLGKIPYLPNTTRMLKSLT